MSNMISPNSLMKQLASVDALVVLDVRSADEYAAGHVPGALHIPLDELEQRLGELPTDKPIVTYSMMKHRGKSRGERAAEMLRGKGYDASVLDGGLPAWQQADAAVLANSAAGALQHMNEDHRNNMVEYARAFAGLDWAEDAEMTALDRYGFDLRATGHDREATARIAFGPPLTEPGQLRPAVVKLAKRARQLLSNDNNDK